MFSEKKPADGVYDASKPFNDYLIHSSVIDVCLKGALRSLIRGKELNFCLSKPLFISGLDKLNKQTDNTILF